MFGLWPVVVSRLKQLGSCLLVQGLRKLVNGRRLIENGPLTLQPGIVGPFDEAGEVSLALQVLCNMKFEWHFCG